MYAGDFFKGLGVGMAAGALAGAALAMDRKKLSSKAGRLVKAAGQIAGGVIKAIG